MHQLSRIAAIFRSAFLEDNLVVHTKKDFPPALGGVITLAPNRVYQINGTVDIGDTPLVVSDGAIITGRFRRQDTLVYTGIGAAIRASGVPLRVQSIGITAIAGEAFDAVNASEVSLTSIAATTLKFGTFDECLQVVCTQCSGDELENGIQLINTSPGELFLMVLCSLKHRASATGVLVDYGSSVWDFTRFSIVELVSAVGGTDISGQAASANLTANTGRGRISNVILNGLGTHLVGITVDDILWKFSDVIGVPDSDNIGTMQMTANAVVTTIGTQNVFVKVAGTTTLPVAKRFDRGDPSINNNLRSVGKEALSVIITITVNLKKSGAAKIYKLQIFKDGSVASLPIMVLVGIQIVSISITDVIGADENTEFDLRIANTEDTDNVTVTDFIMTAASR